VHNKEAGSTGHSGGDFFTNYFFADAIRNNKQPWCDVYRSVDMSICGIQAYRSVLNDSKPYEIPDFRDKEIRKKYENDNWTPDPARRGEDGPYSSIRGDIKRTDKAKTYARKVWGEVGYTGE
ncbi:MAG: hypothetical protein WCS73_12705, partial [Lentisphaeria bacterium]